MTLLKGIILSACFPFIASCVSFAQEKPPVLWNFKSEPIEHGEVVLTLSATLASGWHIYSQHMNEGGPTPTRIKLEKTDAYRLLGLSEEKGKATKFHDEIYDMEITRYAQEVTFLQKVKLNQPVQTINGSIEYLACNVHLCVPQEEKFVIDIPIARKTP